MAWARVVILLSVGKWGEIILQSPGLSDSVVDDSHPEQSKDDATAGGHHEDGRQVDQNQKRSRHRFRQGGRRPEPQDGEVDCWQGLVGRI